MPMTSSHSYVVTVPLANRRTKSAIARTLSESMFSLRKIHQTSVMWTSGSLSNELRMASATEPSAMLNLQ